MGSETRQAVCWMALLDFLALPTRCLHSPAHPSLSLITISSFLYSSDLNSKPVWLSQQARLWGMCHSYVSSQTVGSHPGKLPQHFRTSHFRSVRKLKVTNTTIGEFAKQTSSVLIRKVRIWLLPGLYCLLPRLKIIIYLASQAKTYLLLVLKLHFIFGVCIWVYVHVCRSSCLSKPRSWRYIWLYTAMSYWEP